MIDIKKTLGVLGIKSSNNGTSTGSISFGAGEEIESYSPVDGTLIGKVTSTTPEEYEKVIQSATAAFKDWRLKPAPLRGEIVRQYGERLRALIFIFSIIFIIIIINFWYCFCFIIGFSYSSINFFLFITFRQFLY